MEIVEGIGFWKEYTGKVCIYGLEYVEKIIFVKANCNINIIFIVYILFLFFIIK